MQNYLGVFTRCTTCLPVLFLLGCGEPPTVTAGGDPKSAAPITSSPPVTSTAPVTSERLMHIYGFGGSVQLLTIYDGLRRINPGDGRNVEIYGKTLEGVREEATSLGLRHHTTEEGAALIRHYEEQMGGDVERDVFRVAVAAHSLLGTEAGAEVGMVVANDPILQRHRDTISDIRTRLSRHHLESAAQSLPVFGNVGGKLRKTNDGSVEGFTHELLLLIEERYAG